MTTLAFTVNTGTSGPDILGIRANYDGTTDILTVDNTVAGFEGDDSVSSGFLPIDIGGQLFSFIITVDGGGGADAVIGYNATDVLFGGAGNDLVSGVSGSTMLGGADIDTLNLDSHLSAANMIVSYLSQAAGSVLLSDGSTIGGFERIFLQSGPGNDVLDLSGDANALDSNFIGGEGDDTLRVDAATQGVVVFNAGGGMDRLAANFSALASAVELSGNTAVGGVVTAAGIFAGSNDVEIFEVTGGSAGDSLVGAGFADVLAGGAGIDIINGGDGGDQLDGGADGDQLQGGSGGDILVGGGGIDRLDGGADGDQLQGGDGDDILIGGGGGDALNGGPGSDTASYAGATARVKVALDGSIVFEGDALGDTFVSVARLTGTGSSDVLIGDLNGNVIRGGSSNDTIRGQAGNDLIYGEKGSDNISGNAGDDRFGYLALDQGGDTINDFTNAVGNNDIFNFKGSVFGSLPVGALAASHFAANLTGAATTADHRFIYETDTGILRFDANGTGAGGITVIATLTGAPLLAAADFAII